MDFGNIIQSFTGEELSVVAVFGILLLVYKEIIKPKLDKLKKYEDDFENKLGEILSKDELEKVVTAPTELLTERIKMLIDLIKEDSEEHKKDSGDVHAKAEEIRTILTNAMKDDLSKVRSMMESMKSNLKIHDERAEYIDQNLDDVKKFCNLIYEILDRAFTELEKKSLIEPFDRPRIEDLKNQKQSVDLNTVLQLFKSLDSTDKSTKSRVGRILRGL